MPIRPRRPRRSGVVWTPAVALALTIGPDPRPASPSDDVLRQAWERHGARLTAEHVQRHGQDSRPWAWWYFHPTAPAELRGQRPALIPVGPQAEAADRDSALIELARATWLAAEAHA
jgi:hypothetical protein